MSRKICNQAVNCTTMECEHSTEHLYDPDCIEGPCDEIHEARCVEVEPEAEMICKHAELCGDQGTFHCQPHSGPCVEAWCCIAQHSTRCVPYVKPEPEAEIMICERARTCNTRCDARGYPHKHHQSCHNSRYCYYQGINMKCIPYVPEAPAPTVAELMRAILAMDWKAEILQVSLYRTARGTVWWAEAQLWGTLDIREAGTTVEYALKALIHKHAGMYPVLCPTCGGPMPEEESDE